MLKHTGYLYNDVSFSLEVCEQFRFGVQRRWPKPYLMRNFNLLTIYYMISLLSK